MTDEQPMSAKEVMEGVRAVNEMLKMLKGCRDKVGTLMPSFIKAADGDGMAWFSGMDKVSDMDVDEAQGCLIVALINLGAIRAKTKGTALEEILKDIFALKES